MQYVTFLSRYSNLKGWTMFSAVEKLDLFILDRVFNPFALRAFRQFGVSNFSVSKILIMLGTAFLFLTLYKLIIGVPFDHNPLITGLLCIVEFTYASFGLRAAIKQEVKWHNPKPGQMPENLRDGYRMEVNCRRFFLLLTLFIGSVNTLEAFTLPNHGLLLIRNVGWLLILAGLYFLGCTPPGPRERQAREAKQRNLSYAPSSN